MNSALAILDFEETDEESVLAVARRGHGFFLEKHLSAACDRLRVTAAQTASSIDEWYDPTQKRLGGNAVFDRACEAVLHEMQRTLDSYQVDSLGRELSELAAEWKLTRQKTSSSIVKLAMHPSYQRIIGKGPAAIPFILRELQRAPDHWFWALAAITGEDPVPEEDRGDLEAMARAWIEWGKRIGY